MRKHPINKHVRSPRPTQHELENPKTRHRALVRMGRHRNIISLRKVGHRPALTLVGNAA